MTRAKTQRPKTRAGTNNDKSAVRSMPRKTSPPPPPKATRPAEPPPPPEPPRPRAASVIDDQLLEVTEIPELLQLELVVHDAASHLPSAQRAIAEAGHVVLAGATGREGIDTIKQTLAGGGVDAILVGLPGGEPLIEAALTMDPRRPVIIAVCAGTGAEVVARAHAAGADLVTTRPHDVDRLAPVLLAASRLAEHRRELSIVRGTEATLRSRLEQITDSEPGGLQPFELFQRVLELELKRAKRYQYPLSVALFAVEIAAPPPPAGVRGILRARAGNALIQTIRDIDIATELDHERFLVLLPYTDLTGATEVARRVIAAVANGDPVVAMGRSIAPRFVGAVAWAKPGKALSFGKLMREATQALEQARKDGAELAVQP